MWSWFKKGSAHIIVKRCWAILVECWTPTSRTMITQGINSTPQQMRQVTIVKHDLYRFKAAGVLLSNRALRRYLAKQALKLP